MAATTHWVHDIDPILIHFGPNFGIRYYGLAYALGFAIGWWLFLTYRKKGRVALDDEQQGTLFFSLVLGVMVGGRVGYMLLYDFPNFLRAPWIVFEIWNGGMASHGGFAGVIVAAVYCARTFRMSFWRLGDLLVTLVPPGLMLGRMANFINGELWGRVSDVAWAVVFPLSAPEGTPVNLIPARHPSQLYEAALEGLFLLVYTQWRFWKSGITLRTPGRLGGEFLVLYALVRIFGEHFREPDASLIFGMSRGIFYSFFLIAAGVTIIWWSMKHPVPPEELRPGNGEGRRGESKGPKGRKRPQGRK